MMKPKTWILDKNLTTEQQSAIRNSYVVWSIEKETEKAYLFNAQTDFGNIHVWCPKSQVVEDIEDVYDEEQEQAALQKWINKMDAGLEYNMKLREVLNSNGIKTSMKRRITTDTLIDKLNKAGIEVPTR